MNKFTIGFSILSTLLIGAGCTDEASIVDEEQTGNAVFALQSGDFSLAAVIQIFDVTDIPIPLDPIVVDEEDPTLTVPLPIGIYDVEFTSWELFEDDVSIATSAAPGPDVAFGGFSPTTFDIVEDENQGISINFTIGTTPLSFTPLDPPELATFTLVPTPLGCGNCPGNEVCVTITGGDGPTCELVCDEPGGPDEGCDGAGFNGICGDNSGENGVFICERGEI